MTKGGGCWVVFGGGGFVGMHLAEHLLQHGPAERLVLADLRFPDEATWAPTLRQARERGALEALTMDVRQPLPADRLPAQVEVIVNLAAVHREPGHRPPEYFEANVLGARHIGGWATLIGCAQIVFTSSISVYGGCVGTADERSLPVPLTSYGSSKLLAEAEFRLWQAAAPGRTLVILRPGVVFGPHEGGNVTRLVKALRRGYFFYCGNRDVKKAGGYVKELCRSLVWLLEQGAPPKSVTIANFCLPRAPTLGEYVAAIQRVSGRRRWVPALPYRLLYAAAALVGGVAAMLGIKSPIHPRRVEKLIASNDVVPAYLVEHGFPFQWDLEAALADWRKAGAEDWQ
jgi:nucleoside-diphosphate-sugar epimerase